MSEGLKQTTPVQIVKYSYLNLRDVTIRQLQNSGLIQKGNYSKILNRKPDGLLLHNKKVLAVVEYKDSKHFSTETKRKKATEQSLDIAKHLKAKILIATDSQNTVWINALTNTPILDENGRKISFVFDYKHLAGDSELEKLIDKINGSISKSNSTIMTPKVLDPYLLAKKIWQKIWINTGKEPEKCLYNVVELFIFKFLSDLEILKAESLLDFPTLYKLSKSSQEDALKHYAKSIRRKISELFPKGDDKTTIINGTIFVTENGDPNLPQARLFSELLEDFYQYEKEMGTFKNIDKNFKTKLFESFLKQSAGIKRLGQFFTPRKIVQTMISMSDISALKPGSSVCDPFCGVGSFILEAINLNPNLLRQYKPKNKKIDLKITLKGYDQGTDEKEDERTIILAKANMLIYLAEMIEEYHTEEDIKLFSDVINSTFELVRDNLGTLGLKSKGYDVIVSNPPYVSKGSRSVKNEIATRGLSDYYTFNGTGIEGQCIEWIIRNLKPSGQAFVIIPDSVLRRSSDNVLRDNIRKYCFINAIISLPHRTFYATAKKTYILAITKKEDIADAQEHAVLAYLIREIGESRDANRIETPQKSDLPNLLTAYNQFKGNKSSFKTSDPLCKLLPPEFLSSGKSWIIENAWTRDEKEKLRIVEESVSVSIDEFSDMVQDTMETLNNLKYNLSIDLRKVKFENVELGDNDKFKPYTSLLGYTQKVYLPLDTKDRKKVPIFTAQREPVAFIEKIKGKDTIECAEDKPHISIASDGDGTAGTNIIYHTEPYYLNTSRISYEILDKKLYPKYIYYALQGIKHEYGFNYSHKATLQNQAEVNIAVPVNKKGEFDLELQKKLSEKFEEIEKLKKSINQMLTELVNAKITAK